MKLSLLWKIADADSADDVLDESSISENENEWVPSSWDSLAKPIRSALKSPDKSSSVSTKITDSHIFLSKPTKKSHSNLIQLEFER